MIELNIRIVEAHPNPVIDLGNGVHILLKNSILPLHLMAPGITHITELVGRSLQLGPSSFSATEVYQNTDGSWTVINQHATYRVEVL